LPHPLMKLIQIQCVGISQLLRHKPDLKKGVSESKKVFRPGGANRGVVQVDLKFRVAQVTVSGKQFPVHGKISLDGRRYLKLSRFDDLAIGKFQVFDPVAGPRGQLRAIHVVPDSHESRQYVEVLRRISDGNTNLPKLVSFHRRRKRLYLVLTWIDGESLRRCLDRATTDRRSRFGPIEAFKLFRGLAHGLRHMHHKQNFVHGDIRPENIVLSRHPNRLVLIDFGNAWPAERSMTKASGDGISEFYNAPEQVRRETTADFRSDQFALTVVFYEMLTLDLPYEGLGGKAGASAAIRRSAAHQVAPIQQQFAELKRQCPRSIWNGINGILRKGLELDPAGRYPNASDWLDEIEDVHVAIRHDQRPSRLERGVTQFVSALRDHFATPDRIEASKGSPKK